MRDPTWWYAKAISDLIGSEGLCIDFRDNVLPLGYSPVNSCVGCTIIRFDPIFLLVIFESD